MMTYREASLWVRASACVFIFLLAAGPAWGQLTTWNGNGTWFDSGTWSNGVPGFGYTAWVQGGSVKVLIPGATTTTLDIDGTVQVTTDPATLGLHGGLFASNVRVGYVGAGAFYLSKGGRMQSDDVDIGFFTGSTGLVTIDGSTSDVPGGAVWNNSGQFVVGLTTTDTVSGNGILNIVNGGVLTSKDSIIATGFAGGVATVDGAVWQSSNFLRVGDGGTGGGRLDVRNAGLISDSSGYIGVGNSGNPGAVGIANLDESSWLNESELHVGQISQGTLTAVNHSEISSKYGYIGDEATSVGSVELLDSRWANSINLFVGNRGKGTLVIGNGSTVSDAGGFIATYDNSSGDVTVDHGTWANSADLSVGHGISGVNATATLTVKNGGQVTSRHGTIGNNDHSTGIARVQGGFNGVPSTWTMSGTLYVGGSGVGTLEVDNGARVSSLRTFVSTNLGSQGTLSLLGTAGARGTLETGELLKGNVNGALAAAVNFNGGVLRATADWPFFVDGFRPGDILIHSGGAFIDSNGHDIGILSPIQGVGGLTKTGEGTLNMTAANGYLGLTTVDAGKLLVNGSIQGDALVNSGATLGGSGTIFGAVTIAPGGILSPGNSPGTFQMGSLVLDNQSVLDIELGATSDQLAITGDLTLDGTLNLIGDPEFFAAGSFPSFISYSGTLIDRQLTIGTVPAGFTSNDFALDFTTPGAIGLVSSVPEPASAMTLLIVTCCLRRNRR